MTRSNAAEEVRSNRVARPATWPGCVPQLALKVLLADDEIDQLLPLADVLRRAGLAATIATSADELVFEVRVSPPDVVVLDAEMANGGLLYQLRALISTVPIVLMNGGARHDAMWTAMLATVGVVSIDKPVDARKVLDLLSDSRRFPRRSAD
jgi:DNA-binding NtrC family response regulator